MSLLPCPQKDITQAPPQPKYSTLPNPCANPLCSNWAESEHHTVAKWFTRSWEERDWALLFGVLTPTKIPVCGDGTRGCHGLLTTNKAYVEWNGQEFLWVSQGVREPLSYQPLVAAVDEAPGPPLSGFDSSSERLKADLGGDQAEYSAQSPVTCPHLSLSPGDKCECGYKKPHPKKATSPKSAPVTFRIPAPVQAEFMEIEEQVLEHLGITSEKYARYKAVLSGYVALLQGPGMERAA